MKIQGTSRRPLAGDFFGFSYVLYSSLLHLSPTDYTVSKEGEIEPRGGIFKLLRSQGITSASLCSLFLLGS